MTSPVDLPRPPRRLRALAVLLAIAAGFGAPPGRAQTPEGPGATYTFLVAVAEASERCELLEPWEAATIRAQARRVLDGFSANLRAGLLAEGAQRAAATRCTDTRMLIWLDGAREGVLREWLPPYLGLFRAFAVKASPPVPFLAATRPGDRTAGVAAIDAQILAYTAAGIAPEGGGTWEVYMARIADAADNMVTGLMATDTNFAPDDAAAYMVEAGIIVTLWLERAQ